MPYPVKLKLYKNGHLFSERVAENDDDLNCPIEMDTGTGWLDALGLYHKLVQRGCYQVTDTFRVCNSYEKWGDLHQEVIVIKAKLQRMDMDEQKIVTASSQFFGFIAGVGIGAAVSVITLAIGIGIVWLLMYVMAYLSTLPVFFYILFIIAGLAALVVALFTYVIMYAAAGMFSHAMYLSISNLDKQDDISMYSKILGTIAAALSVPLFFLLMQAILSNWSLGNFNEQLVKLFGQGILNEEVSSAGWIFWVNLVAGIAIAVASSWFENNAETEELAIDEA